MSSSARTSASLPSDSLPAQPPAWSELAEKSRAIGGFRPNDAFVSKVLQGALAVGRDPANPIRGNLLAAAVRELTTYLLHDLAPDDQVRACSWFAPIPGTTGPTRAQRATFIVRGGLSEAYVETELGLDTSGLGKPLVDAMAALNRATHIQPHTVLSDDASIRALAADAFSAIENVFKIAEECRRAVAGRLTEHVDRALLDRLMAEAVAELDELSTHTTVDEVYSDSVELASLDHSTIRFSVNGTVCVDLQYGSGADVRRGDGVVTSGSFPFSATLESTTVEPAALLSETIVVQVDNSKFFE